MEEKENIQTSLTVEEIQEVDNLNIETLEELSNGKGVDDNE